MAVQFARTFVYGSPVTDTLAWFTAFDPVVLDAAGDAVPRVVQFVPSREPWRVTVCVPAVPAVVVVTSTWRVCAARAPGLTRALPAAGADAAVIETAGAEPENALAAE